MVGRRAAGSDTLAIWANGERVGLWQFAGGEHRLQYDSAWIESPAGRPLSLSMPFVPGNLPHRGDVVRNFFDNLLPDSDAIRRRLQAKFATAGTGPFDLLGAIGRDCVGAVQILPQSTEPRGWNRIEAEPLDEAGVESAIDHALASTNVLGHAQEDELRISIAGAQEKTALLLDGDRWCRPLASTPSTHIFKLPLGLVGNMRADMSTSVENEWLCARILHALGFPTATCGMGRFGRHKVLVVERFDRTRVTPAGAPAWLARLPQEDLCQALGVPGTLKYESDGGPGMRSVLRVLQASSRCDFDTRCFVLAQLAFWLLAATDGHAKNFSVFLERGGTYRMTPLYDVLSAWPIIGSGPNHIPYKRAKLAMALRAKNTHYHLHEIQTRHWQALAREAGVPFGEMVKLVESLAPALDRVAAELPGTFPARVWQAVREGCEMQARRFAGNLSAG